MIEVIPAILPVTINELRTKVALVKDFTKYVQLDMCDGVFVPTRSWPQNGKDLMAVEEIYTEETGLPGWESVNYEFDLMVKNASSKFEDLIKLGPSRMVFHLEAEDNLLAFFEKLDPYYKSNIEFGIAINTTTDPALLRPFLEHVKFIQCMGIEIIGKQRQSFDARVLDQITKIKAMAPEMIVSVDGSVNADTAHDLVVAGATRLVIGSAIFDELDTGSAIHSFQNITA